MCPTVNGKNDKFHYAPKCQISQKYVHQLKKLHEDIQQTYFCKCLFQTCHNMI